MKWRRYRFHASEEDNRPVKWPPLGPWWETGVGDGYTTVVAYLPPDADLKEYWPEADNIDYEEREEITFTSRFPRPDWWKEDFRNSCCY